MADRLTTADKLRPTPDVISVLGFRLNPRTGEEVIATIAAAVADRRRLVMGNVNTHAMAKMFESPAMASLLSQDDACVMIDSMPILFLANMIGHRLSRAKRTTSLDFYDEMFRMGATRGWKFGYVGGEQATLSAGLAVLRERFPGLDIEGRAGFFDMHDKRPGSAQGELLAWLKERSHDIVIAGMGMPRQEEWVAQIQDHVDTRVFLMAGAYLDYQVGAQKSAPRWMGQVGLEWAYRLARSPRRLGYRYLLEPIVLMTRLATRAHPQRGYWRSNKA